jgi:hypothetical protein
MAYYALIDDNNIVINVISGRDEDEVIDGISDWEAHYSEITGYRCLRTSYNTKFGVHLDGKEPYRINYAGIGFTYNEELDGFFGPKPYESWLPNANTGLWEAPVEKPENIDCIWNESTLLWQELPPKPDASTAWVWNIDLAKWIEL